MPSDTDGVERFYGRWARVYDVLATRTPGVAGLRRAAVDSLDLSPGDSVLDAGCGTGANLPFLRRRVGSRGTVIGIDRTSGVLDRARDRVDRAGWRNVHVTRGDATRPPLGDVDAVLASFLVGMLPDPDAAVRTWGGLVDDGGRVALLDMQSSRRGIARPLNAVFRAFVAVTAPPTARVRYRDSPVRVLDDRVAASRDALRAEGDVERDEALALGFVRLTAARVAA